MLSKKDFLKCVYEVKEGYEIDKIKVITRLKTIDKNKNKAVYDYYQKKLVKINDYIDLLSEGIKIYIQENNINI